MFSIHLHRNQMLSEGEKEKEEDRRDGGSRSCPEKCEGVSRTRLLVSEACVCYLQMTFDLTPSCLLLRLSKRGIIRLW